MKRLSCTPFLGGGSVCNKISCIIRDMGFRIRERIFPLHLWARASPSKRRVIETTLHLGPLEKQDLVMLEKKKL